VAGTLVIREREDFVSEVMADVVIASDVEAGFRFTREELNLIGEVERRLIRRTLRRAESLSNRAARPIIDRATQAISRRIGRADPIASKQQQNFLLALLQASERLL
jgi:fructose 1,6-bisphosphatase